MKQTEGRGIWRSCLSLLLALALCLSMIPAQAWAVEEETVEDGMEAVTVDVTEEEEMEAVDAEDEPAAEEETEPEEPDPAEELPEEAAEESVAEEAALGIVDSGSCGVNVTWSLDKEGVLTVSGVGPMTNFENVDIPWYDQRDLIQSVMG